jgi:hypothetical protein
MDNYFKFSLNFFHTGETTRFLTCLMERTLSPNIDQVYEGISNPTNSSELGTNLEIRCMEQRYSFKTKPQKMIHLLFCMAIILIPLNIIAYRHKLNRL